MPTASVVSKAPPIVPHRYAKTVGLNAWHVLISIVALGARRATEEDDRTEQLAREQPHLKRDPRMVWIVEGGQERLCDYLAMPERTLRRCLRQLEETWFPDGDFFAIWRKDRDKQRQEVNAYDLDELISRIEARLAHPSLPLEEAIRLAPGDLEQPALPLAGVENRYERKVSPSGGGDAPGRDSDQLADPAAGAVPQPAQDGASAGKGSVAADASSSAPDVAGAGVEPLTEARDRHQEAGLPRAKRVIRERPARATSATGPIPRPTAEEAVLTMAFVLALHPDQLRQVLDEATGDTASAPLSGGEEGTSGRAPVAPEATALRPPRASCRAEAPGRSGGQNDRQGGRSLNRNLLLGSTETTRAQDRSAVVPRSPLGQGQDEILQTALRIRQAVPTYWHRDALDVARRFGPRHVDLCLRYLAIERHRRRIDDPAKWLYRTFRNASSSWLRAHLDKHDRKEAARRAFTKARVYEPSAAGFDAGALRSRLASLAATLRSSRLASRRPDFASDFATRINDLAGTFPDTGDAAIADVERAEAVLHDLDAQIAAASAEAFADEASQARAAAAAALRPHAASMSPRGLADTVSHQSTLNLLQALGVPQLSTFYLEA